jgi:hypothetical protein
LGASKALALAATLAASGPITSMGELAGTLQACFRAPERTAGSQVTVRFRFGDRGVLQGRPQIVSSASVVSESDRRALDAAVLDALRRCTPLDFAPGFAAAVAGRVITLHLIGGAPPQGI